MSAYVWVYLGGYLPFAWLVATMTLRHWNKDNHIDQEDRAQAVALGMVLGFVWPAICVLGAIFGLVYAALRVKTDHP